MKDNNSFLITVALLVLSVFLLFQAYNAKITLIRYQAEKEAEIEVLKNPEEEFVEREFFNVFTYKIPTSWSILYDYGNEDHDYLTMTVNDYIINKALIGGKPGTFDLEIYVDTTKYDDDWWQEQIDSYAASIEFPSYNKDIDVYWGDLRFIAGGDEVEEGRKEAHETYFYKLRYGQEATSVAYIKIQMTEISDADYTKYLEDFVMSIEPIIF
jgi:hypothetical protein